MVEIHSKMGYALDDLFEALQLLRDSLNAKIQAENDDYASDEGEKLTE